MKKQTVYSYLQRSLVKVLTKSINSNTYKSLLAKPLNTIYASRTSYITTRPARKLKTLGSLVFLHKDKFKILKFFRKVDTKKTLLFTCKLSLISFIRPQPAMLLSRPYIKTQVNLTLPRKLNLTLNHSLNSHKLLFFLLFLHGLFLHFFGTAHSSFFFQAQYSINLLVLFFFFFKGLLSFFLHFNHFYRIKTLVGSSLNHLAENWDQSKNDSKTFCFTCFALFDFARKRSFFVNSSHTKKTLFSHSKKKKWYLFQNKNEKENKIFYFYTKKPKPDNSLSLPLFWALETYLFYQSFYKRKNKSINYMKRFHNLSDFFSLFFISRNNKIIIFNYVGFYRQTLQAQEVLYLRNIDVPCSFPLLYLSNTNINRIFLPLYSQENKTSKKKENISFFFRVLPFLNIIFHVARKYIRKKKKDLYKQSILNSSIYKFNEIIENNFLSFRPFYGKVVKISKTSNSLDFFLMRPLFALTRLDTFFICESLKLPIYPDKSNLRVDFLRNRVRKQMLPAIRILLNPQFDTILCKFNESDG